MIYKPTYCCHCGEKIERTEWLPWTSGRFCDVCDKEFKFQERLPLIFALIFAIFGIGSYLKNGGESNSVALKQNKIAVLDNTQNKEVAGNNNLTANAPVVKKNEPNNESSLPANTNKKASEKQKTEHAAAETDNVYFCGAETKKGTPCSRKVKGGGRCWQHTGREAILPPEKLLISQ